MPTFLALINIISACNFKNWKKLTNALIVSGKYCEDIVWNKSVVVLYECSAEQIGADRLLKEIA